MTVQLRLIALTMLLSLTGWAQAPSTAQAGFQVPEIRTCGTITPPEEWDLWFNARVEEYLLLNQSAKQTMTTYTIPVIVHVIHGGQTPGTYPNLSQTQINSQINVLNNDFAGTGFNVANVPQAFAGLVADCSISFCLALLDTAGNLLDEPGIDRVNHITNGWGAPTVPATSAAFQTYFNDTIKPATIWDPTRYLNIWISDRNAGTQLLGYATFPAGSGLTGLFGTGGPTDDGIWVWSGAFGEGSLAAPYNKGRTATHEIGHWLGLRHIWGDANCGNDFCADTPTQADLNFGCPSFPIESCFNGPNGDMFMNFMDYCNDACLYMFTPDQRTRMQTAMTNSIYRKDLTASSATLCTFTPELPVLIFSLQTDNCIQSEAVVLNASEGGKPAPTYTWSASPADGVTFLPSATAKDPSISVTYPGNYEIKLAASNMAGETASSDYLIVADCSDLTGISAWSLNYGFRLAPQPAPGFVRVIPGALPEGNVEISIHNNLGQCMQHETYRYTPGQPIEVGLGTLSPGVYTISLSADGQRFTRRMVIGR